MVLLSAGGSYLYTRCKLTRALVLLSAGGCYLDGSGLVDKLLIISGGSAQVVVKNIRFTGVQSTSDGAVVVQEVGLVPVLLDYLWCWPGEGARRGEGAPSGKWAMSPAWGRRECSRQAGRCA